MKDEREITNAKITSTRLGYERGDTFLSCWLQLEFPPGGQGFGGYVFDDYNDKTKERQFSSTFGLDFIDLILKTVGVESWEELPGKYLKIEHNWAKVFKIGHIIEDKWFDVKELQNKYANQITEVK